MEQKKKYLRIKNTYRYMQNSIACIKENYGDILGYVKTVLGLTDEDIAKLQSLLYGVMKLTF